MKLSSNVSADQSKSFKIRENERFKIKIYDADISILQNIYNLVDNDSNLRSENLLNTLNTIGNYFNCISWNENNPDNIRNKHGYKNRSFAGANKLNAKGAKIRFEELSKLKILTDSDIHLDTEKLKGSIDQLKMQINYIIRGSYIDQTFEDDYLIKVICKKNDINSINKIVELLKTDFRSIDENSKILKYYLGYIFVQIGETAKEISDYSKPSNSSKQELNPLKFLFSKLGNYRQENKIILT